MYGPTTGDSIRLADTDLIIQIEKDYTSYGDEVVFGGGKVIRDGMGQHPLVTRADGAPDVVITNAVILDYTGIYKADIAIRDGKIAGIGKAGNPLVMEKATTVTPGEWNIHRMLEAAEGMPINVGFTGKGQAAAVEPLAEQVRAGAIGLKVHEDWGATASALDHALTVADQYDVQ
ncbi:hypothetical protein BGX30_003496, partial [Mortierella sp. GBA39]